MASSKVVQSISDSLSSLREEQASIGELIQQLESTLARLGTEGGVGAKRRGRPPKALVEAMGEAAPTTRKKKRGRPPGSGAKASASSTSSGRTRSWTPAQRRAAGERMRKYWAERRGEGA